MGGDDKKHEFMSSWVIMVTKAHSYIGGSTGGSSTTISGSTPMSVPSTSASGAALNPLFCFVFLTFLFLNVYQSFFPHTHTISLIFPHSSIKKVKTEVKTTSLAFLKRKQTFVNGLKCFCVEKLIRAERNIQGSIHTGLI